MAGLGWKLVVHVCVWLARKWDLRPLSLTWSRDCELAATTLNSLWCPSMALSMFPAIAFTSDLSS